MTIKRIFVCQWVTTAAAGVLGISRGTPPWLSQFEEFVWGPCADMGNVLESVGFYVLAEELQV